MQKYPHVSQDVFCTTLARGFVAAVCEKEGAAYCSETWVKMLLLGIKKAVKS